MVKLSVGIDAGADTVSICVLDEVGCLVTQQDCPSMPAAVIETLSAAGTVNDCVVGIEAGATGTYLIRKLRDHGYVVRVLETRYLSGYLQITQNKTDRNDAKGIAEVIRLDANIKPDVFVKTEEIQKLRSELALRHRLMKQRIAIESALRAVFRLNGGKIGRIFSGTHLERSVGEETDRLRLEGNDLSELVEPVLQITVALRRTLERTDRRLRRRADGIEVCRRFMSIPGVGCICALSFYTAVEDPTRFQKSTDVGPYLGLVPKISQSGISMHRGRITRRGSTMTRTHLVSAAKSLMQQSNQDSRLRQWTMRIVDRAGRGKARIALARKLATIMLAMWKSGEPFNAHLQPADSQQASIH